MEATAASADGRSIVFEAPVGTPLAPGGFAVVETDPPLLSQITACGSRPDVDGRRMYAARGHGDRARPPAPAGSAAWRSSPPRPMPIAAWADEHLGADGLDVGALVHAPDVRARLDAGGLARHTFLCGQSGSGKTYTTGVLLEQIARQTSLRLIVIDPNLDHVGLRRRWRPRMATVAAAHRARAGDMRSCVPSATALRHAGIGMRFSNFDTPAQALRAPPRPGRRRRRARGAARQHRRAARAVRPGRRRRRCGGGGHAARPGGSPSGSARSASPLAALAARSGRCPCWATCTHRPAVHGRRHGQHAPTPPSARRSPPACWRPVGGASEAHPDAGGARRGAPHLPGRAGRPDPGASRPISPC